MKAAANGDLAKVEDILKRPDVDVSSRQIQPFYCGLEAGYLFPFAVGLETPLTVLCAASTMWRRLRVSSHSSTSTNLRSIKSGPKGNTLVCTVAHTQFTLTPKSHRCDTCYSSWSRTEACEVEGFRELNLSNLRAVLNQSAGENRRTGEWASVHACTHVCVFGKGWPDALLPFRRIICLKLSTLSLAK